VRMTSEALHEQKTEVNCQMTGLRSPIAFFHTKVIASQCYLVDFIGKHRIIPYRKN